MITGKAVVTVWFVASVAGHLLSQVGLWLWLVFHDVKMEFVRTGVPGYIEKCYSEWAERSGRSPDVVIKLRVISTINAVAASVVFAMMVNKLHSK